MDFKSDQTGNINRQQRPVAAALQPPAPIRNEGERERSQLPRPNGSRKRMWIIMIILIVVAFIVAAVIVMWFSRPAGGDAAIQRDKYQAVFLTNGQVYFGRLAGTSGGYMQLTDVYYLQVQQDVQGTAEAEKAEEATNQNDQSQVSLAKLGSELHGPENAMQINREQVLFWENLTDSSKVVTAIKQHTGQ